MSTTALPTSTPPVWEGVSGPKRALWRAEGFASRHRDAILLTLVVAIGLTARLSVHRGFWLDESTTVAQAKMSFGRMLSYMRQSDVHPPLFQSVMWLDIRAFGTSEFAVRLPSLVFGTALVPMLYGAGRDLFDRRAGLMAALIGALGPATVWYSQEARMYPMFMFFALCAIWAQVRAVRTNNNWAWAAYTASTVALIWTHYFSALHIMVQQAAFLILMFQSRKDGAYKSLFRKWIRSAVVLVMLVAPLVYIPLGQIQNYGVRDTTTIAANGSVASGAPVYTAISNLASALVGYHSDHTMEMINSMWPLFMLAALLVLGRGRSKVVGLLTALIFVPLAVLFVVGLKRNDVFELRYFAGAVPALALLLGRGLTVMARKGLATGIVSALVIVSLTTALVDEQADGGSSRTYDFRSALTALDAQQQPGDKMFYEPFYLHPVVHYYAPKFDSLPLVTGIASTTQPGRIIIVDSLAFAEKEQSRQRVNQVVERLQVDRKLVQHIQQNNIEVWVFA